VESACSTPDDAADVDTVGVVVDAGSSAADGGASVLKCTAV